MRRTLLWIAGAVVVVAIAAVAFVYISTELRLRKSYAVEAATINVPADEAAVERGRYIAHAVSKCADCHGEDLGGAVFIDDPAMGLLYADNLTSGRGGIADSYDVEDWVRALRHGVGPDDNPLLFMPSQEYWHLTDQDLGDLLAYLQSLDPVVRLPQDNRVGPLARVLFLTGELPLLPAETIDHDSRPEEIPARGPTAEYGAYLIEVGGCVGCHGPSLSGGKIPGTPPDFPPAANITLHPETGIADWTSEDWFRALREGERPDGSAIDEAMPWKATAEMRDDDLLALWLYVRTVPPKEEGGR